MNGNISMERAPVDFVFNHYSDAEHGWLRVPLEVVAQLGLINSITPYSHWEHTATNARWAYLEEDRDATLFVNAARAQGLTFRIHHVRPAVRASRVRGLAAFPPFPVRR